MSTILTDSNNDWDITGGRLSLATGITETVQRIGDRLRFFKTEWFLDLRVGVPYFDVVLVKNPDLEAIRRMIQSVIASTPGVKSVTVVSLTFDRVHRNLTYTWSAKNDDGAVMQGGEGRPFIVTAQGVQP